MDMTSLMFSMLFGAVGMGFMLYGKKMAAFVPIGAGLGLMIVPYLITNLIVLSVVGLALMAAPFVIRGD
jgi:hypothetical protein